MSAQIQDRVRQTFTPTSTPRVIGWALVAIGVLLRVRQLASRSDLWLDEVALALNITQRSWKQLLFSPLDSLQVCPPVFLQLAKASVNIFGATEFAFRLPSLIFAIAGLLLFAVLVLRTLRSWEIPLAILLFVISPVLLIYSAELKQYSTDVFAAVLLTLLVVELRRSGYSRRWTIISSLSALVIVWFSDPSSMVLVGLGLGLVALAFMEKDRAAFSAARLLAPAWSIAIFAQYLGAKSRTSAGILQMMHEKWHKSFFPIVPHSAHEAGWLGQQLISVYSEGFGLPRLHGLCVVLMVVGVIGLWRSGRRDIAVFVIGPLFVTLIASAAHVYPFKGRVILFLYPAFAIALSVGIVCVSRIFRTWGPAIGGGLFVMIVVPQTVISLQSPAPWAIENITPVLAHVATRRQPNDKMYVFWGAQSAVRFYGPRYGITPDQWSSSGWQTDHTPLDGVWKDLDQFRGASRLWMIFSHSYPNTVRDRILAHLDSAGVPITAEDYPGRTKPDEDASAFLYDMRPKK